MKLPKIAAALLAAALAAGSALPALAADQRAELELEVSIRCTGEAADETLTVRLTALDGASLPEGCEEEAELDLSARDCRAAEGKTVTKTFAPIVYTQPGIYEYTITQDVGRSSRADYDDTVFHLRVMAAWDADGQLRVHQAVRREGEDEKTELLFKNSYHSADPMPPPVTPPYLPDKPPVSHTDVPAVTPPATAEPVEIAEIPAGTPAASAEPVTALIQTGQLLWPVPVLACSGLVLLAVSFWLRRRRRGQDA